MGLDIYIAGLADADHDDGSTASTSHPDHFFKLDYFRSSYNDGGFDTVVGRLAGGDLYSIFDPESQNYEFTPSHERLAVFLQRAQALRDLFNSKRERAFAVDTIAADHRFQREKPNIKAEGAIAIVNEQLDEHAKRIEANPKDRDDFGWFTNGQGSFFLSDPPPIIAAIPGKDVLDQVSVHLVYRMLPDTFRFYSEALDIIVESLEAQLKLPNGAVSYTWSS